ALLDDARPFTFESLPALGATVADMDEAHLWSFMRAFSGAFQESTIKGYPTGEVLERYLLLASMNAGELVPTFAGLVLFGRDESVARLMPRSSIIATRFGGDNNQAPVIERMELNGNLATVHESALKFISRYADLWEARPAIPRSEAAQQEGLPARANYYRNAA